MPLIKYQRQLLIYYFPYYCLLCNYAGCIRVSSDTKNLPIKEFELLSRVLKVVSGVWALLLLYLFICLKWSYIIDLWDGLYNNLSSDICAFASILMINLFWMDLICRFWNKLIQVLFYRMLCLESLMMEGILIPIWMGAIIHWQFICVLWHLFNTLSLRESVRSLNFSFQNSLDCWNLKLSIPGVWSSLCILR